MSAGPDEFFHVAIACGGTGGHLFPGLAVAHELKHRQCAVTLIISPKEVDQTAVQRLEGFHVLTLPSVGLSRGNVFGFLQGFGRSYGVARKSFLVRPPHAALAMGGFTSAPPVLAAKRLGARSFLHESNSIPGRSNRWLAWVVERAFVGFPGAVGRLHSREVTITGTPVRPQFKPRDPAACRWAFGLDPVRPVVLVMGGSQGASGINRLLIQSLPLLAKSVPQVQWLHLSGDADFGSVKQAYAEHGLRAAVFPFFREMERALGAATVAVSRAGASSLAELAAMRVPPILVPYPSATDNHQLHNARAFQESGAACLLAQNEADAKQLSDLLLGLLQNAAARAVMQRALDAWHRPLAAEQIAESMMQSLKAKFGSAPIHTPDSRALAQPAGRPDLDRTRVELLPGVAVGRDHGQKREVAA